MCFLFKVHALIKPHKVSSTYEYIQNKSFNETFGEHHQNENSAQFSYTNPLYFNQNDISVSKLTICANAQGNNNVINSNNLAISNNGDTVGQDDAIRTQYSLLPYPPVLEEDFLRQQSHYNSDLRNIPYIFYFQIALENINHFLYNGGNAFV